MNRIDDDSSSDRTALLDWARDRMTPAMVKKLASCDNGYDLKAHMRAISEIIDFGRVPFDLQWEPSEVFGLWSWRPDENDNEDPVDHVINVFACSVLVLAGTHPDCTGRNMVGEGLNEKLASLIWSVFAFPEPPFKETARFLWWLRGHSPPDETNAFALLGLLITEAGMGAAAERLDEVAAALVKTEAAQAADPCSLCDDAWRGRFVLGLTHFDQHHRLWVELARRVLQKHPVRLGEAQAARAALQRV